MSPKNDQLRETVNAVYREVYKVRVTSSDHYKKWSIKMGGQ